MIILLQFKLVDSKYALDRSCNGYKKIEDFQTERDFAYTKIWYVKEMEIMPK